MAISMIPTLPFTYDIESKVVTYLQQTRNTQQWEPRQTASKYLDQLIDNKLVTVHKIGKENYYINDALYQYLYNAPELLKFKGPAKT